MSNKDKNNLMGDISHPREIRGYSAYELAVIGGFDGTVEEWLASLRGEKGDPGEVGVGIKNVNVDDTYTLWITLTDGTKINAGRVYRPSISGVWVFNDTLVSAVAIDETVAFTSNGETFTGMTTQGIGDNIYLLYPPMEYPVYYYDGGQWNSSPWAKTVDFGSKQQEVSPDFYRFMETNATREEYEVAEGVRF